MTKLRASSLILLLVPWLFTAVVAQDYSELVFSGFVELAPTATTDEAVDFSKVEIQLFTEDNKFVDRTHCSSNGFFLIPIYDKKSYVLKVKPPVESIFEPESIPVNLKGLSNEEVTKVTETSFSFKFVGFSLTDHVRIEGSSTGAVGVKVGLFDSKKNKVAETQTTEGGNFRFDKVITGKYSVQLESKDEGFYWREGEGAIQCELGWKKGQECNGKLVISSFEVKGVTVSQNNILNKHVIFLYNEDKTVASKSTLAPIKDHPLASAGHSYVSYSLIDKDGNFKFTHIPKGKYFLKIYTSDKTNKIEIEPDVYNFEVQDGPVEINNPFSINRFGIKGRVVDSNGKGINNIKVTLDGEIKAHSDAQGYYYIEKVQVGTYTLEGQHEHLFFKPIANVRLEPTMGTLPELVLSAVDLCGEVSLKDGSSDNVDSEFANARFTVYLGGPGGEKRSTIVDQNGKYCFEVQPGRYNIYPVVSNVGARSESLLSPKSREVEVSNEPILDVSFYRHRLSVAGKVNFLKNAKPAQIEKTKVTLSSGKGTQKTVSLAKDGTYQFEQILPGSYRVDIENDNFCWESDSQRVDLQSSNVTNIVFEQTGFAFKYQTTRALEVRITPPSGKPIDTQLLPSSNSYCVESAGTYKITPDVCYQFAQPDFSVSTDDTTGVVLDPIGYMVRGDVVINETILPNTNVSELSSFIVENIHVSFQVESNGTPKQQLFKLRFIKREDEGYLRFQYTNYVEPNSNVVVELKPKAKATAEANEILKNFMFNPTQVKLHVSETCISDSQDTRIEIRKGKIYTGTVQPQLNDWTLTVSYAEAPEGTDAVVHTQHMNSPSFKLGPFPDFHQYEISAEKEGYKFDPTIKTEGYNQYRVVFTAHKLSHLRIQVLDEERRPVPGALLFVSSMSKQNFLKLNNYTNEKGAFTTHSLVKGDYLVRPVLKEYSFNPVQTTITIEDGEHKELTIIAKRVAYSAFGRVHKLNKAGCAGLKIQAVPQGDAVPTETTETDEEGNYRLKGLVPGMIYAINVEKSSQFSAIKPERLVIEAKDYDLKNIEFIGFDKKQTHTIAGSVQFDSTYTEDDVDQVEEVQLRLFRQGQSEPVDTKTVKFFRYFEFKDLQPADYTIKAIIKKTKSLPFEYTQDVSSHQFGENAQVPVAITVSKERARIADSTPQGSVLAPVLILIVIFLLLNIDTLSAKYKKYRENQSQSVNKKRS